MTKHFTDQQFAVFDTTQLKEAMTLIQMNVQPVFRYYGAQIAQQIQNQLQLAQMPFVHVAKHLRRTVNPPRNTWVAIGGDQRGYKRYPHFQLGINPAYVFIVLALIDQPDFEKEIAQKWQGELERFVQLPADYIVIPDHTQLAYVKQTEADFSELLGRLERVKKAELMVGRIAHRGAAILADPTELEKWISETVQQLLPLYEDAMRFYN